MTEREKIAHLLRRFGMGATVAELDRLEPLGVAGTLNWLLDYEKSPDGYPIDFWEFCHEEGLKEIYVDPFRAAAWWSLRMALTRRPLEQKLTFFWHDHFAVSGAKVEFGPSMVSYLEALRGNALDFPRLLQAVAKEPAMLRFLDTDTSLREEPNENFARELLELFTMGEGSYTERDIKELARCFTGWGIRYLVFESGGERVQEKLRESVVKGTPTLTYCFSPALFDDGLKEVLGREGLRTGEEALAYLALHPKTAAYVTSKLWDFFGAGALSPTGRDRLARTFLEHQGKLAPVLRALAELPEFWSEACVRKRVKSPVDFVVPIVRQLEVSAILLGLYGTNDDRSRPVPKPLRDTSGLLVGAMYQQGMLLLFPPDVGGWEWGDAWITPGNMLARVGLADLLCGVGQPEQPIAALIAQQVLATGAKDAPAAIEVLCRRFDAPLPPEKRALLAEAFEKNGGIASLSKPLDASKSLSAVLRLMFGSPEFQLC